MKSWEIIIFDENEKEIKRKILKSDSKYFIKKTAKHIASGFEGSSYSFKEV